MTLNALLLGDLVGQAACKLFIEYLPKLKQKHRVDIVIANGENAFEGKGISDNMAAQLKTAGVDIITSGNHIWNHKTRHVLNKLPEYVLRPANYGSMNPGKGTAIIQFGSSNVGVINLIGRTFMPDLVDNPLTRAIEEIDKIKHKCKSIFVDFHAETSSEKQALAWFLDGKVTAVVGTHTHVQTADERILTNGTAYITDLGMSGPYDSVIGMKIESSLERFYKGIPSHYELADKNLCLSGVLVKFDADNGKAETIERIFYKENDLRKL
jgi:metallophosphoesterase (TIGR00282 family)